MMIYDDVAMMIPGLFGTAQQLLHAACGMFHAGMT
jgi:hypothetical protein